jgi:hypothetical protein
MPGVRRPDEKKPILVALIVLLGMVLAALVDRMLGS